MRRTLIWMLASVAAVWCLTLPTRGFAETFYLDPQDGSPDGDGSQSDPWESLQQVVEDKMFATRDWNEHPYNENRELETIRDRAPIQPGDTLVLMSGYHGDVVIAGAYNKQTITIRAGEGETPRLSRLLLRAAANWTVEGLTISPSFADDYQRRTMIEIDNHRTRGPSHDITVKDSEVYSVDDASSWSAADWDEKAANGITVDGENVRLERNTVRNVASGISVSATGDNAFVGHNTVDGFSGDGLRGLGDNSKFVYNTVKNAWDVDDTDDNGFQSSSTGPEGETGAGEVTGVVLRGNLIINHEDPSAEMRTSLQGIGLFDGMYVDWTIENNVVVTDNSHGITMRGVRDSTIVNNSLIDIDDTDPGPPWIKVDDHKDGTASENVVVRNNLTPALSLADEGVTADHNIEYEDASAHFVDPGGYDLHLLEDSAAVDAGSEMGAPSLDRDRIPRPQGEGIDIGAYEWHEGNVTPVDAGGDAGGDAAMDAGGGGDVAGGDATIDAGVGDTGWSDGGTSDVDEDSGGTYSDIGDDVVGEEDEGCSCSTSSRNGGGATAALLFLLAFLGMRRRFERR